MQPGDLDLQRPDVALPVEIGEGLGDLLGDRDRARRRERAVVHARAGDDVGDEPDVRRREPRRLEPRVDRRQVPARHVRQDDVLLVADAQLVVGVLLGEIGEDAHLLGRRVARGAADRLQRDGDDRVVRQPVRGDVGVDPGAQPGADDRRQRLAPARRPAARRRPRSRRRARGSPAASARLLLHEGRLDPLADVVDARLVHEDLQPRLALVVAPAEEVVDVRGSPRGTAAGRPWAGTPAPSWRSSACARGRRRS